MSRLRPERRKKFLSYYRPYRGRFALVLACALTATGMTLLFPLCVKYVTETALTDAFTARTLVFAALGMIALTLAEMASNFYFDYFGHCVGAEMENDLRQELFAHLEKMSFSFYDTHRVGEVMSSLTNDLQNLSELYHHGPEDYLVNSVQFLGASAIMCALDWRLALCVFAFLPVMAVCTLRLNRRVRAAAAESQARIADINARAEDSLSGIRVSQAFAREAHEKRLFAEAGQRFTRSRKGIYLAESYEYQVLTALTRMMYVAVVLTGALGIWRGFVDVSSLIAFLLYISSVTEPVRHLAWMTTQFQQGLAGFDRVADILETAPDIIDVPDAKPLHNPAGDIAFEDVSFRYREEMGVVLSHADMRVRAGECVAIAGVSGAGKTTLCALLPRFYEPEGGRVTIGGQDIRTSTLASLRDAISIVQQDTFLFTGSVMDNIRYGKPDAADAAVLEAARRADADEFIRALPEGYATDVGPRGVRLSGGQKQRIAIARAFLRDAPILILDEATSALDSASERAVHASIERLRQNRTTIMIAHRLSTIREADRIVVIGDGGVLEQGGYAELMRKNGEFTRLYPS